MRTAILAVLLSMVLLSTAVLADVPGLMNYQGTLTDDSGVAQDTTVDMTFSIYTDSVGGSQLWTETQSVVVEAGIFNVLLGRVNAISDAVFNGISRWLGVQVGGDPELQPRQHIASVGYSFQAAEADTADYARNAPAASDGDWTIAASNMYSAVPGNVGIGVTNPSRKLHMVGADAALPQQLLVASSDDPLEGLEIGFRYDTAPNIYGRLQAWNDGARALVLQDVGGNVGIGTTAPDYKLDVNGTAGFNNFIIHNGDPDTWIGFDTDQIDLYAGNVRLLSAIEATQDEVVINEAGADVDFRVESGSDANALFVRSSDGRVGIGTASPIGDLNVGDIDPDLVVSSSSTSASKRIAFYEGSTLQASIRAIGSTSGWHPKSLIIESSNLGLTGDIEFWNSGSMKLIVKTSGRVGIRAPSPQGDLHIYNALDPEIVFDTDGTDWYVGLDDSDTDKLKIGTGTAVGSNTSMTFATDGNVGIGTTSPSYNLHVYNSSSFPTAIYGYKSTGASTAAGVMGVSDTRNLGYLGGEMGPSTEPFSDFNYGVYGRVEDTGWGGFGGMFYNTSGNWGALAGDAAVGYNYGAYGEHSSGNYGYLGGSNYSVRGYHNATGNYGYLGTSSEGVYGYSSSHGVYGYSGGGYGVYGYSGSGDGVRGYNSNSGNYGYLGGSSSGVYSYNGTGRYGYIASSTYGVRGHYDANTYGYLGSSSYGGHMKRSGSSGYALYTYMDHTGTSPGGGYGILVSLDCDTSGFDYLSSKSAIKTSSDGGVSSKNYLFGVSGEQFSSTPRRGGGVLGVYTASRWGCLAYTSSGGSLYGAYFTSWGTGTGKAGIGFGSSAELLGGWVKGELYGLYASGDRYASYTDGNAFSNGYGATLHDVGGQERVATFTPTSMEVDVYAHGVGRLVDGKAEIFFKKEFVDLVSKEIPVTITVTPIGLPAGLVCLTRKSTTSFSVELLEIPGLKGYTKDVSFDWIAIGRRRGFESRPEIPAELAEPDFDTNMRGFAFNEGNLDGQSRSMWYDGSSLRWDTPPPFPVPVEKLVRAEQERREREREEEEVRRMEEENQKMFELQKEEKLERERLSEAEEELKPMRKVPIGENTTGLRRRTAQNK